MNCKNSRNLRLALSLGYLWGMGAALYQKGSVSDFVGQIQAVFDLIGLKIPVEQLGSNEFRMGDFKLVLPPSHSSWYLYGGADGKTHPYDFFWDAITHVVKQHVRDRVTAAYMNGPLVTSVIEERVNQALAELFDHDPAPLLTTDIKAHSVTTFIEFLGKKEAVHMQNYQESVIEGVVGFATHQLYNLRYSYGPIFHFEPHKNTNDLIQNAFFQLRYVDPQTADAIGTSQGWYVARNEQPYRGPFADPQEAEDWIKEAWGSNLKSFELLADLNDRALELRRRFTQDTQQIENAQLSDAKKKARLKDLREQYEFGVQKLVAPFIQSEKPIDPLAPNSRVFRLNTTAGNAYQVNIGNGSKKTGRPQWRLYRVMSNDTLQLIDKGGGWYDRPIDDYVGCYDALLHVVKTLIIQGDLSLTEGDAHEL